MLVFFYLERKLDLIEYMEIFEKNFINILLKFRNYLLMLGMDYGDFKVKRGE